jgi:hypothetical protein
MTGHALENVQPGLHTAARPSRSNFVRHCLVGALALFDLQCSHAFASHARAFPAPTVCGAQPNRCRSLAGPPLVLSMGGRAPNVKANWISAVRSKVKKALTKIRDEALDDSWQAQAMVYCEERQAAKDKSKVMEDAGMYATQMLLLQSLNTRKNLYEYQLQDATPDRSFGSLYSDICDDDHASLPFMSKLPEEEEDKSDGASGAVDERSGGRTGPAGIRYLQEHLIGVPVPDFRPMPSQAVASTAERLTDNLVGEKQDNEGVVVV